VQPHMTEAIDRLYLAARRRKYATGPEIATAEQAVEQAVREALIVNVSHKKIQQATGYSLDQIHAMRPRVVPKPRPASITTVTPSPTTPVPPAGWPPDANENIRQQSFTEKTVPTSRSVWARPSGLYR